MTAWTESYLFGIVLSIFAFALGVFLNRKTRLPLFNPLLVATALVILVLSLLRIPLAQSSSRCFSRPQRLRWRFPSTISGASCKSILRPC